MSDQERGGVVPQFFKTAVENPAKSKKEGRPIFDEVEMVRVFFAGDKNQRPCFVVDDEHRKRWPKEYEAFKKGEEFAASGTPLEKWPQMTTAKVAELKALGIFSVENLAEVPDGNLGALGMGAREWREKARAFIKLGKDTAIVSEQAQEIAVLKEQVARLLEAQGGVMPAPKTKKIKAA